ncbi:MAG: polysaccharide biosynthesis C-terminal domain-containing protein [Sulfurospirillaceae bacterium]|nr:polysaccharide biosynthesis C-terminal domain-containing protein [Sulfurospirillaceae bacterium]
MSKSIFLKGLSFSYLRQVTTLLTGIISVPLMLHYFGATLFGIWALILGLAGYLNNISFGIPSAMSTLVAKTANQNEKYKILQKSTLILSAIVFALLFAFLLSIYIDTNWIITLLGNIANQYVSVTKQIFILFVIITLLKIPLNLYIQFFVGMNLIYIFEIYQTLSIFFNFLVLLVVVYLKLDIYYFAFLTLGLQILLNMVSVIHVMIKFRYLKISVSYEDKILNKDIIKSGFAFFQVGIAVSVVWSTDNLVINHFLSPEFITPYAIAFKMFTYIFIFSAMINGVVGPIYGNAFSEGNFEKINRYSSSILKVLPVIGGFVWFSLIFFAKDVIYLWTGTEKAFGGYLLIFALGLYGFILSYVNTFATIIYSLNLANKVLLIIWGEAVLNFILSIILVKYFGIGGVALATALAAFFTGFIFLSRYIEKLTDKEISFNYDFNKKHFFILVMPSVLISMFSVQINIFWFKLILFIVLSFIYIYFTWKFVEQADKQIIINILKRKV